VLPSLSSLNGQDPNGTWSLYVADDTGGDDGFIAGGWSIEITTAPAVVSNAVLSLNPSGINFPAAGACTLPGVTRTAGVTASNTGTSGTINLLSASITGSSAFGFFTAPPTFPVALTGATTQAFTLGFQPTAAQAGPQNATLTVTYNIDGGATQTATYPLSGQGDAEGAGFLFRSSLATAACTNGVGAPGTAFIDPLAAGHTRATTLAADNAVFTLNLATNTAVNAFGPFRLFGASRTNLHIGTNGYVFLGGANSTFTGGLPVGGTATPSIQVIAMDLTFAAAVAGDNTGVAGAPGVFYGLSDADGDGDQDLVITWWHAYDAGSTPGAAGQYVTAQLILMQVVQPNAEDIVEMRFPDGNDANGVPFRQNTGVAGTDNSIENDAVTGLGEVNGAEAAIYRLRNGAANAATAVIFGNPLYATGGGSTAVRFEAETQAVADGAPGWRMLGLPVRNAFVDQLATLNLIQGVAGGSTGGTGTLTFPAQYPTGAPNLYTRYDGAAYVMAPTTAESLVPGQGFLWYLFDQNITPTSPDPFGIGTSRSYELPMPLQATGAEPALDGGSGGVGVTLHASGDGWNLLANPYRDDINTSALASWARGGTLVSAVPQIWNPNAGTTGGQPGSYVLASTQGNLVSAWQGFMLQNNTTAGAVALTVPTPRTEGAPFIGRAAPRFVAFELAGQTADENRGTVDRAAVLFFAEDAGADWDLQDAGKLVPLNNRYATVAFVGERNGNPVLKAQESRALDAGTFEVPLAVTAVGTASELTLSWPTFENVPAEWAFTLRDLVTGTEVDLRAQTSYTFSATPTAARGSVTDAPVVGGAVARLADARFVLAVAPRSTAGEGSALPAAFALHSVAPNPVVGPSALVRFDLPQATDNVSVDLFDLLGRRVASLASGAREAGTHTVRMDTASLPSGIYVVRLQAGTFTQAQRVTVAR
jgi:hypothetical protein